MKQKRGLERVVVTAILCGTLIWTACSTAWTDEAALLVTALIPAVSNVLSLVAALEGKSVSAQDVQSIQHLTAEAEADFQLIQSLITQYKKADPSDQPGILIHINSAIKTAQANLNGILPALHIEDPATRAKITAVVEIVLSEVDSLAALMPLMSANASPQGRTMALAPAKARPLRVSEFVASYNTAMTTKTGDNALDHATKGLDIHVHGKLVRLATALVK